MGRAKRLILLAGIDRRLLEEEAPFLRRLSVEAHFAKRPAAAVPLVAENPYDLLMLGFPMADLQLPAFIAAVRGKDSPCRSAGILLLAEPDALDDARRLLGQGVNRVVPAAGAAEVFEKAVSELANVAPRCGMRTPVRMEVQLGEGRQRILCQTENLSATGMLLRGAAHPGAHGGPARGGPAADPVPDREPVGHGHAPARSAFELTLPDVGGSLSGEAEVVRHTAPKEGVHGFAVRFLSLADEGQKKISAFLDRPR